MKCHQWKYLDVCTVLTYLYITALYFCYFILHLHCILEANTQHFTPLNVFECCIQAKETHFKEIYIMDNQII